MTCCGNHTGNLALTSLRYEVLGNFVLEPYGTRVFGYLWGIFGAGVSLEPGKAEKKWETLREPSCRLNESVQCPLLSFTVAGSEEVPSKHWVSLNLKQIVQDVSLLITVEKSALLTSTVL